MPEENLEIKFGKLADSQLQEQVPALVPYRVGFQILDEEDDGRRAVGVIAFILNNIWAYMPIFYTNARLKGFERLYLKSPDMFVPAKDNWVNVLKEEGLRVFGRLQSEREEQLSSEEGPSAVMLETEAFPYSLKTAELEEARGIIDRATAQAMFSIVPGATPRFNLLQKVAELGPSAVGTFANTLTAEPEFANAVFQFYTPKDIQEWSQKHAQVLLAEQEERVQKEAAESKSKAVTFVTDFTDPEVKGMGGPERKILADTGVFVRDLRDVHTKVFEGEVTTGGLTNPHEAGFYDILLANGDFMNCLVIPLNTYVQRTGRTGSGAALPNKLRQAAIIPVDRPDEYCTRTIVDVFGSRVEQMGQDILEGKVTFGMAPTRETLTKQKAGEGLLFVQGSRKAVRATVPYNYKKDGVTKDTNDGSTVDVHIDEGPADTTSVTPESSVAPVFVDSGKLRVRGGMLRIPEDVRIFRRMDYNQAREYHMGNLQTIERMVMKESQTQVLGVRSRDGNFYLNSRHDMQQAMSYNEALRSLVTTHGIYAGQAQGILKEASRKEGFEVPFLLKYAVDIDGGSNVHGYANPTSVTTETDESKPEVPTATVMPQQVVQQATRAAQSGQKDIFDVSVLQGLIDAADVSELRKEFLIDILKGMDSVGRMGFLFQWHNDLFAERYGEEDMRELEDTLKREFIGLGDLALFLKQKKAFSPSMSEAVFGQLSEDIGSA